jgi:SAM-dependent methyltransferase
MTRRSHQDDWERHWAAGAGASQSLFGRISAVVRRQIISRAVRHYTRRYFHGGGIYVECGCGTAQSSARIPLDGRRFVALDFSTAALEQARRVPIFHAFVQGDIFHLPFAEESVAGIWNLGVLEHFDVEAGGRILREFRRVLRPGAMAVLFWPPQYGSSRWVLAPIEWLRSRRSGPPFRFFPDEVNRLRSKQHARRALESAGLEAAAVHFTPRDAFIHMVVVARKPA